MIFIGLLFWISFSISEGIPEFSPQLILDDNASSNKRNIAFLRAAYSSSTKEIDHCAHLVTNGLTELSESASSFTITSQYSDQPNYHSVLNLLKADPSSSFLCIHPQTSIYITVPNSNSAVAKYSILPNFDNPSRNPSEWQLHGSTDNSTYFLVDSQKNILFDKTSKNSKVFTIHSPQRYLYYRLTITQNSGNMEGKFGGMIQFSSFQLLDENGKNILVNNNSSMFSAAFTTSVNTNNYWKGSANSWLYIDLGALSTIDSLAFVWGSDMYATKCRIQVANATARSSATTSVPPPAINNYYQPKEDDWVNVSDVEFTTGGRSDVELATSVKAYFVRIIILSVRSSEVHLCQLGVMGTNALKITSQSLPAFDSSRQRQDLSGGDWSLIRDSEINVKGDVISTPSFFTNVSQKENLLNHPIWVPATVPGTVLVSYINIGAIPDPNYGDQQLQISDTFFTASFWYRTSFKVPHSQRRATGQGEEGKRRVWLNFDGINWKADVYLNGKKLTPKIEGAFIRTKFDITSDVVYDDENRNNGCNYLAVFIYKNDHPGNVDTKTERRAGTNGGVLGADNPTIHASVGWDWVMTVRGRDTGIYNDVFLTFTDDLVLRDPWVETHVNESTSSESKEENGINYRNESSLKATLTLHCDIYNAANETKKGKIVAKLTPSNLLFEQEVEVPSHESVNYDIKKELLSPHLWWPHRYGEPYLYKINITLTQDDFSDSTSSSSEKDNELILSSSSSAPSFSDTEVFNVGIRELTYYRSGTFGVLVNGQRIFCSGGNWGMDESMLRCRSAEDYDIRVRLHKEAHFTMIRNWVGMTGDDEFYCACDRQGILIDDDFWLANPWDGPNPNDEDMFLKNARDKVRYVRKHPSLAFYCGRNEGFPPNKLEKGLNDMVAELDPPRMYVSSSADPSHGVRLSGHGPYSVQGPVYYYRSGGSQFHTERGMPNVPSLESLKDMIPEEKLWPRGILWGLHDFALDSAQRASSFIEQTNKYCSGGGDRFTLFRGVQDNSQSLDDFVRKAQLVDYENHKAMFEGMVLSKANALLMWMSQSCWPSMVWQSYDYFFDTNGGFFGLRAANQPLNPILNLNDNKIYVANLCGEKQTKLELKVLIHNFTGSLLETKNASFSLDADEILNPSSLSITPPSDKANFITTLLYKVKSDGSKEQVADNFYWVKASRSFPEFDDMANGTVSVKYNRSTISTPDPYPSSSKTILLTIKVQNNGTVPLVHIRLIVMRMWPSTSSSSSSSNSQSSSEENESEQIHDSNASRPKHRVLPVYYSDNYFSLAPGQSKDITAEFNEKYLEGDDYSLYVEAFNMARRVV